MSSIPIPTPTPKKLKSIYMSQYIKKKQIILWVPPTLDLDDIDNTKP
jgi:hypothetical protein